MSRCIPALPVIALVASLGLLLGACASSPDPKSTSVPSPTAHATQDLQYGTASGEKLLLNACLPRSDDATPAVILVHGGGFQEGNKEAMMGICRQLAADGFAAFSIDYRLMPQYHYPAQVEDLSTAIEWLREPEQVKRFEIDPDRIGVFGSSAGAIMAVSQGAAGEGSTTTGSRVAAVVALSPAVDFTVSGLALGTPAAEQVKLILAYLGCTSVTECTSAQSASSLYAVDPTDPPFFLAASQDEIVPVQQSEAMRAALEAANVPVTLVERPGSRHAIALLDEDMRANIFAFLHEHLD
jgi:acetyl esterase